MSKQTLYNAFMVSLEEFLFHGLAIGCIGFISSFTAWLVAQIFPWEFSILGNSKSFVTFGVIAAVGFFVLLKILPETKGKTLERIEAEFTL